MPKRQTLILLIVLGGSLVAIAITAYITLGGGNGAAAKLPTEKRFTAKSGTTRSKAVMLSSDKRPSQAKKNAASRAEDKPEKTPEGESKAPAPDVRIKSLSEPAKESAMSPTDRTVRSAMNALSPEAGIEKLEEALANTNAPGEQAKLQAAMAMLYAQVDPPDEAAVEARFEQAMDSAQTLATKQQVAAMHAQYLMLRGQDEQAQQVIGSVLGSGGSANEATMRLYLMLGQMHESSEEMSEAELAYLHAFRQSMATEGDLKSETEAVLRLSAMRLAQLYRQTGREAEEAQIARALTQRLAEATPPAP